LIRCAIVIVDSDEDCFAVRFAAAKMRARNKPQPRQYSAKRDLRGLSEP
jgi:hypothetical protein